MRDANLDTSNIYETERAEASRGLGGAMGAASLSRRTVLRGAGVAALAVGGAGVLAACGSSGSTTTPAAGGASSANVSGPAPKPLAAVTVHVVNGEVLPG